MAMPKNAATGRAYSGINILILWGAVVEHGFQTQSWITFRQALSLGGHVRKGERGTTVVYADRFIPDRERDRAQESGEEPQAIPFLKRFTVFNVEQCDGLPAEISATAPPVEPDLILPEAEALIEATGADLRVGGNRAYYDVVSDYVRLPPRSPVHHKALLDIHLVRGHVPELCGCGDQHRTGCRAGFPPPFVRLAHPCAAAGCLGPRKRLL